MCIAGQSVPQVAETNSQNVHSAEIPGPQTSEPGPSQPVGQSNKYLKTTKNWSKFFDKDGDLKDIEYREFYDWDELMEKVTDSEVRNKIIDLLKKMLQLEPKKRISSDDILKHSWFTSNEISSC